MPLLDGIKENFLLEGFPVTQQLMAGYVAACISRFWSIPFQTFRYRTASSMAEIAKYQKANPAASKDEVFKLFRDKQRSTSFWKDMRAYQKEGVVSSFTKAAAKGLWTVAIPFTIYENIRDYYIWSKQQSNDTPINWGVIYKAGALGGFVAGVFGASTLPTDFVQTIPKLKEAIQAIYPDEQNATLRANLFKMHAIRSVSITMFRQILFLTTTFAYYDLFKYAMMKTPETEAEKIQAQQDSPAPEKPPQDDLVYEVEKIQEKELKPAPHWFEELQKRSRFFETAAPITVSIPASVGAVIMGSASIAPVAIFQNFACNLRSPLPLKECLSQGVNTGFRGLIRTIMRASMSNITGFATVLIMFEHFKFTLLPRGVTSG